MALCWPYILLFLYSSTRVNAITLSPEVEAFIPSCAQVCFESFVSSNFPESVCGTTPTLDCLCSSNSTSGYTIGEGAVQCIVSEENVSFCTGNNATGMLLFQDIRNGADGNQKR